MKKMPDKIQFCQVLGLLFSGPIVLIDAFMVLETFTLLANGEYPKLLHWSFLSLFSVLTVLTVLGIFLYRSYADRSYKGRVRAIALYTSFRILYYPFVFMFMGFKIPAIDLKYVPLILAPFVADAFVIYILGFSQLAKDYFSDGSTSHNSM